MQSKMTDEQKKAAWANILKMAEDQGSRIELKETSRCERMFTFGPITKVGFFAGGIIGAVTTGGLTAIAQGALWGAVSGKVGDIAATRLSEHCKTTRRP